MAKYRIISPKIWNDAKFRELSDSGKLVFFMLLTHPHTSAIGTLRAFIQGLAAELGWDEKAFREAFQEGLDKGLWKADLKAGLIWLPNFIKYNLPQSPNVLKSWVGSLDDCPECELKNQVFLAIKSLSESLSKAFGKAFREAFRDPLPNQEQDTGLRNQDHNTPPISPQGEMVGNQCKNSNNKNFEDEPDMEFMQLREFYDSNARLEWPLAGWAEFKKLKTQSRAGKFPGIFVIMDDIAKRIEGHFWSSGHFPGLAKYLNERIWEQKITNREKSQQKTFAELEEERQKKNREEQIKRMNEKYGKAGE